MRGYKWFQAFNVVLVILNTVLFVGYGWNWWSLGAALIGVVGFFHTRRNQRRILAIRAARATRQRESAWFDAQLKIRSLEMEHGIPLSELTVPHKVRGRK